MARLRGTTDSDSVYGGRVSITITVILVTASISRGPYEYGALAATPPGDPVFESPGGQFAGAVHCLAVVIRAP